MEMLKVTDVKTKPDVHRLLAQECIFNGSCILIVTFVLGIATIPYGLTKINFLPRLEKEYKVFAGIVVSLGGSVYSGLYYKNRCQRRIIKELKELKLGHLVEGIED